MDELGICEVARMKLTELIPAEYNPRSISNKAFKGLGVSLSRFGLMEPIVWNRRTGNMVGGHQRFKHLVEEGEEDTDVVVVDLDGTREVALNIALNSKHLRGRFTQDAVGQLKMVEARIGSVFAELGLLDLHNAIASQVKQSKNSMSSGGVSGGSDAEAIVTCPKCRSQWKMKNKKVLVNRAGVE